MPQIPNDSKKTARQEKQDRLSEALRANLRRRKAQHHKAQNRETDAETGTAKPSPDT